MQLAETIFDEEDALTPSLLDRVKDEIISYTLTQGEVSKEAGLSKTSTGSKLNQWLQGKYTGDNSKLEAQLEQWLASREARRSAAASLPIAPLWYDTSTATRILNALRYAQMAGDFAAIYGGAGLGKTQSAKHHAKISPNVWLVTMSPASSSMGSCLRRIANKLGMTHGIMRTDSLEDAIVERLKDTNGLMIIDEAQHLNNRALHTIQRLQDATQIGFAMMGNELVYSQLTGGRRSAEFAQLFSRIGKRVRLQKPSNGDIKALLDAWQITGREEHSIISEIAKRPGALRVITKTLRLASMFAQGHEVKTQHIQAAWKDLGGEI